MGHNQIKWLLDPLCQLWLASWEKVAKSLSGVGIFREGLVSREPAPYSGRGHSGGTSVGQGHSLTFSDAVAILVPCRLRAMQLKTPSWAGMSTGGFSVLARSTSCTWPVCVPGKARSELLLLGHRTQRPKQRQGNTSRTQDRLKASAFPQPYLLPALQVPWKSKNHSQNLFPVKGSRGPSKAPSHETAS